jgi:hypothetical protein
MRAGRRAPTRWRLWAGGAAALVLAAGSGGLVSKIVAGGPASAAARTVPTGTAAVVRTSLSTTTQIAGTLGYAGPFQVTNELTGSALTALPPPGRVIRRGQSLYEVDGTGVPLFYGARPMWRPLQAGVTPGRDVYQLDQNLVALGYTDYGYLTPSDTFTAATAAAISAWQEAAGQTPTGAVQLGQVVFEPGPVRVDALVAAVGSPVQPGTAILTATSTRRSVDVQLPVNQEYLVRRGDPVTITLPDGTTTTPGVIATVAPVATAAPSTGSGSTQASPGTGSGSSSSTSSGSGTTGDTVDVTVRLIHPAAAGPYDQAPVEVNIVDASASNVLAVPINALVALVGGGYAVEVVDGSRRTLVAVRTGLFADTLVQVSGAGLSEGMRVEVPSS